MLDKSKNLIGKKIEEVKMLEQKPKEWKTELREHRNLILLSLFFLLIATVLNSITGNYVNGNGAVSVPDLILDHLPTLNLSLLFVYGITFIMLTFFIYPLFFKVKDLHMVISQLALLSLVRSFFVSLTHLSIPPNAIVYTAPVWFTILDFKNALFFSAHTAFPFLGFLLFRKEKIRFFFLAATIVMALTVLFMHVHYSIDVFAALFITYGSYKLGSWLFSRINHY